MEKYCDQCGEEQPIITMVAWQNAEEFTQRQMDSVALPPFRKDWATTHKS